MNYFKGPFRYDKRSQEILCKDIRGRGEHRCLEIGGYWYLAGRNNLKLPHSQALNYMDRFGEFVTKLLNENEFVGK